MVYFTKYLRKFQQTPGTYPQVAQNTNLMVEFSHKWVVEVVEGMCQGYVGVRPCRSIYIKVPWILFYPQNDRTSTSRDLPIYTIGFDFS